MTAADVRRIAEEVSPSYKPRPELQQALMNDIGPIEARSAVRCAVRDLTTVAKAVREAKLPDEYQGALLDALDEVDRVSLQCRALLHGDESADEALRRFAEDHGP